MGVQSMVISTLRPKEICRPTVAREGRTFDRFLRIELGFLQVRGGSCCRRTTRSSSPGFSTTVVSAPLGESGILLPVQSIDATTAAVKSAAATTGSVLGFPLVFVAADLWATTALGAVQRGRRPRKTILHERFRLIGRPRCSSSCTRGKAGFCSGSAHESLTFKRNMVGGALVSDEGKQSLREWMDDE